LTQKSTEEIRRLISKAKLDFDSVENRALNAYLPRIFRSCPFNEDICTAKQCLECAVFTNYANNKKLKAKMQPSQQIFGQ
jgi:hypothetical protein